jgi:hypothetical protein
MKEVSVTTPSAKEVLKKVGFEVLMAVSTKMAVFWIVALSSLVAVCQRFRGTCSLLHSHGSEKRLVSRYLPL